MEKQQAKHILKNTGYIGNEVGVAFDVAIKSMDKLEEIENIITETENQHYELQGKKVVMSSLAYGKIKGVIENG